MDDLIIIGGSAAGISAAIYAARRGLSVRLVTQELGGEVARSGEIENWPGIIHTTGVELADLFVKHLRSYSLPIEEGVWVESVVRQGVVWSITGKRGDETVDFTAKAVIVATGVHPRELGVSGEKEYRGKGLSYCTVCDGPLYRGKRVITVGSGNSALESALMLSGLAKEVIVLSKYPEMKGEAVLKKKLDAAPNVTIIPRAMTKKILGDAFVTGLEYEDAATGKMHTLETDGVFVHIGMIPNSSFLKDVELTTHGEIVVNRTGETNQPGLFAAGDVTDIPFNQIAIAAGLGVTASLQAARYLDNLEHHE